MGVKKTIKYQVNKLIKKNYYIKNIIFLKYLENII